ncbi:MAG: hypothetical protein HY815_11490 [Candidatus Riflebacteria bacterium]|nr:hypothetical protein [Candidatus Riflebacteria bacterium]
MAVIIGGQAATARDGAQLIDLLTAGGTYDVAAFDARMFVDYLGCFVRQQNTPLPIRIPTWLATGVDPLDPANTNTAGRLLVPANHSEHILSLFRHGTIQPVALVKWYIGIPEGGRQGTLFKAAVHACTSWANFRVVRTYPGPEPARRLVTAAGHVMRILNVVQGRYAFDRHGYGILGVCNDTTGILESIMQGDADQSSVWPHLRDPRYDFYYAPLAPTLGLALSDSAGLSVLPVVSDTRPDVHPKALHRPTLLRRIGANIPTREPAALHFPELCEAVELLAARSAEFRAGLSLR